LDFWSVTLLMNLMQLMLVYEINGDDGGGGDEAEADPMRAKGEDVPGVGEDDPFQHLKSVAVYVLSRLGSF
jgi:hypothetical protein